MEDAKPASLDTPSPASHPTLSVSVKPYGISLTILATVALVFALDWAQSFFVSLLVGILIAYTLNPLVQGLEHIGVRRLLATTIVMVGVLGALVFGAYSLRGQIQTIINQLPTASSKISKGIASLRQIQHRNMQKVESAARVLERATKPVVAPPPPADPETPQVQVVIQQPPSFKLNDLLLTSSMGAAAILGQVTMVIFLVFFLLIGGDTFKRKLVRIAGTKLSQKKITVLILDDINSSIQRYMFMLLVTNIMVGILSWIAFRLIGLENAGAWATAAAVLHLIPYFGPAVAAGVTSIAAFIQFDSFSSVLLVAGVSLAIATFIGMFVTTWMTGRIAKMNTAAVFISLLFWGWLWGVWGMLLSIPIIVIVKVISQQIEQLHPVAELLGE
jgi:predicted PurR-regulated permease PerM